MSTHEVRSLVVAGLNVDVYSESAATISTTSEVVVVFLLHGRTQSMKDVDWVARSLLDHIGEKRKGASPNTPHLVVAAFDQRNHGSRLVNTLANSAWKELGNVNDNHAIDMYGTFVGTSRDVSFLIDFLPPYLYPLKEKTVTQWLVAGISLGGHAAWISLRTDPRIRIGIPIIGCADYLSLMSARAAHSETPFKPPYVPETLVDVVKATDPAWTNYEASDESNPFYGKKVLALAGADDQLVPFAMTEKFFDKLDVGPKGKKKVIVEPGVGHACTPSMVKSLRQRTSYGRNH